MKFKTLLPFVATLALSVNFALAAEEDTPLAKEMSKMNKSLRTLKRQIADPAKKDANLELLVSIKKNTDAAAKLEPAKTKDVPAGEKAAYLAKYKDQMKDLDKTYEDLAKAIKEDKADDAKKAVEKLSQQKEKGHKDFGADEDK